MSRTRSDTGLQPERTALAWRRTALSIVVAALVAVRLLPPVLGDRGLVLALSGVVAAGAVRLLGVRRARQWERVLADVHGPRPGGALLLVVAGLVTTGAVVGILLVGRTALGDR